MRKSGILMHISSLPGKFGIGTLGEYAYKFVDFLKAGGQSYWQILPLCPTSYGDSPYQSFSTFAGNPYFIDLDILFLQGYLNPEDYQNIVWSEYNEKVDYSKLFKLRFELFKKMQSRFFQNKPNDFDEFCLKNNFWLDDYALFMSVKDYFNGISFDKWNDDIRTRQPQALKEYRQKCKDQIDFYKMLQFLFFQQWNKLKDYANKNNVEIIGDLPIYVAADSADVWANPKQFLLDNNFVPIEVAGCPPDAFSKDGQLWGNPLYDWTYMCQTDYDWWVKRFKQCLLTYNLIRIDHFRGFDSFYCIKFGMKNAKEGVWRKGPGINFFNSVKKQLGKMPLIAEDLGFLTESVENLLKKSGYPGMKVLQFAFDSREESDYLPHNYNKNCVVYTGTHDNDTILGWIKTATEKDIQFAKEYLRCEDDLSTAMMVAALSSVADTAILTMQDIIGLDSSARMNIPSTVGNNWDWRANSTDICDENAQKLYYYTKLYSRLSKEKTADE